MKKDKILKIAVECPEYTKLTSKQKSDLRKRLESTGVLFFKELREGPVLPQTRIVDWRR